MAEIKQIESGQLERAKTINKEVQPVPAAEILNLPIGQMETGNLVETMIGAVTDGAPASLRHYDVVQVYDRESNHYGVLFQVGDVRGTKVHGYYLMPKGERAYVTFNIDQLRLIGTSRVRSRDRCSPKWLSEFNTP